MTGVQTCALPILLNPAESDLESLTYDVYLYLATLIDETLLEDPTKAITPTLTDGVVSLTDEEAKQLRTGGYLKIEVPRSTFNGTLRVEGIDANMSYYTRVRTRLIFTNPNYPNDRFLDLATYSAHKGFTTSTTIVPPDYEVLTPPAPTYFGVLDGPTETKVTVEWKNDQLTADDNASGSYYYEIARGRDVALTTTGGTDGTKDELSRDLSLVDLMTLLKENKQTDADTSIATKNDLYTFFITKDNNVKLYTANGIGALLEENDPLTSVFEGQMYNKDLKPNTIYYYYIRTVREENGQTVYSDWIGITLTTSPIATPVELKIETLETYPSIQIDKAHEILISFQAEVPYTAQDNLQAFPEANRYHFDIAVMGEDDAMYSIAGAGSDYKVVKEQVEQGSEAGKLKFVYRIIGLKHARRYEIKVRMVDDSTGSLSLYTNPVTGRTNFSEQDQEKENHLKEYLEVYERAAGLLSQQAYWVVDGMAQQGIYKYRSTYTKNEMGMESVYQLRVSEEATYLYYYLPNSFFDLADTTDTMIEIQIGAYVFTLRPGMFKNDPILKEAAQKVEDKEIEDYYIGLCFNLKTYTEQINGQTPLTQAVSIEAEVIYTDDLDMLVEDDILEALNLLIVDGREEVVKHLERVIDKDQLDDETLQEIVDDEIEDIKSKHAEEVADLLDDATGRTKPIETVARPFLIVGYMEGYSVEGYHQNNTWENLYAFQTVGGFGMEASQFGWYIFTGSVQKEVLLPSIPGAQSIIVNYQLTDFFSFDEYSLQVGITKEQLYGAVARIIGAQRGTDYRIALQNRGVSLVMPSNVYQTARLDETLYVVMQAYEVMYYKPVTSITITDKGRIQNIEAFQWVYRDYVYGAIQLGVVTPVNKQLDPAGKVTTENFLKMLVKVTPN